MRFSAANAREFAARSVAARKQAIEKRINMAVDVSLTTEFEAEQICIVRAHLRSCDERLSKAKDSQDFERYSRSRGLLAEQERIARGQPLPGAYRPDKQRVAKRPEVEPL